MKSDRLKLGLIGLAAVLLQLLIFRHLSYGAIEPDVTLIVLIWIIATKSRTTSLFFAAYVGLLNDFLADLWGLHLISKIITTLLVYSFVPRIEETRLFFTQVFLLLFVIALIHHLIFLLAAFFAQIYQVESVFFQVLIGSSLLTAAIGSIIYLLKDH